MEERRKLRHVVGCQVDVIHRRHCDFSLEEEMNRVAYRRTDATRPQQSPKTPLLSPWVLLRAATRLCEGDFDCGASPQRTGLTNPAPRFSAPDPMRSGAHRSQK